MYADAETMSLLLEYGAEVDHYSGDGHTPLTRAFGRHGIDVISMFLEYGAKINDWGRGSALSVAAYDCGVDVISLLLEYGADVNGTDKWCTALISAAKSNGPEVLSLLLEHGADANMTDKVGKKAIDYASENEKLKGTDAYRLLLEKTTFGHTANNSCQDGIRK
jgi:ankyrin repeat protein